jgi:Flp pilus assembly protein TadD
MGARWALIATASAGLVHGSPPGSVEPQTCRPCHRELFDRYLQTPMGRSFSLAGAPGDPAQWNRTFHHEASGQTFEMFTRGDDRFIRRFRLEDGRRADVLERRVTHRMGSGERAVSYLHRSPEGRIFELPVSWYSQEKAWAMSPGYDRKDHAGFTRQVNHKCMFCHNAYPQVPPAVSRTGWDADVLFPGKLPLGIDCERCHGPGEKHSKSRAAADIVNPARLDPDRSLEVCMQCHYETTTFRLPDSLRRFGRSFYSYQAGTPLGFYMIHFDHAPGTGHEGKFEIVSAAYRLRRARCFQKSAGRMTCLSCHNLHASSGPISTKCASCHATVAGHPAPDRRDCTGCHMPKRRTEDVVHVVMTDHEIARGPQPGDLLAPIAERIDIGQTYRGEVVQAYPRKTPSDEVYAAIAQVKERANLTGGIARLEAALGNRPVKAPEPWLELAEALKAVGRSARAEWAYRQSVAADAEFPQAWNNLANLLAASGRRGEAIAAYRQALARTPWDAEILVNLALTLVEDGRTVEALETLRAAVAANPSSVEAHANAGALLLLVGRRAEAAAELRSALAIDPNHAKARANLVIAVRPN